MGNLQSVWDPQKNYLVTFLIGYKIVFSGTRHFLSFGAFLFQTKNHANRTNHTEFFIIFKPNVT